MPAVWWFKEITLWPAPSMGPTIRPVAYPEHFAMSSPLKHQRLLATAKAGLCGFMARVQHLQTLCRKRLRRLPRVKTETRKKVFAAGLATIFVLGLMGSSWMDWA